MSKALERAADNIDETLFTFAEYDEQAAERSGYSDYSYWRSTWNVFMQNKMAVGLLIVLGTLLAFTFIQPYLPGQKPPTLIHFNPDTGIQLRNVPPGKEFILGSNAIGQDLWARLWSGTRTSLFIGFVVGLFEAAIGITVGAMWGYVRWLERIITEIYNVWNNIPSTVILVLMTYVLRPSVSTLILAMCITGWLPMARLIRNLVLIIRDREYNLASRALGTPTHRIIVKNILPYLISVIMMRIALSIPIAIGSEVFLTYIGLGLPLDTPSLGNLVNEGRRLMMAASMRYQLIYPSIMVSIITVSFYVLGNAFADASDPRNHV